MSKRFINDFVKEEYGKYIKNVSKQAVSIEFQKYFKIDDTLNTFIIKPKQAYYNNHLFIFPYINYFMEFYDKDRELLVAYYKIKFMIDRKNNYSKEVFLSDLYEYILTDSMVKKIKKMVNDNYVESLAAKREYKHKSIQFLDEHGKILLCISIAIKIFIPLVTHFINKMGINKTDLFLLESFEDILGYFEGRNNIKNKLYEFVLSKVNTTQSKDKGHWIKAEIEGEDIESETTDIYNKIMTDIIYKMSFEGNLAAFISTSINKNVTWMLKKKFGRNRKVITDQKDSDGLSDLDKIEMNMSKMDESYIITGEINAKQVINKLIKKYKIKITDDELNYYLENLHINKMQKKLIFQIFGSDFGCIRDMHANGKIRLCKLIIIMKKQMQMKGFFIMQHILSGVMQHNPNIRKLPKKKLKDMIDSDKYEYIRKKYKYCIKVVLDNEIFRETLNTILNSEIIAVDYKLKGQTKEINIAKYNDLIMAEYMQMIDDLI